MSRSLILRIAATALSVALATLAFLALSWPARGTSTLADEGSGVSISIEKEACTLGQFVPAISCSRDQDSPSCCGGLHTAFNAQCPCKALPGIVMSHGGSGLGLMDNMLRCSYTEGVDKNGDPIAPVDFVTKRLGCVDREEWCNDKAHNADVRLTESNKGFAQLHDDAAGWVYVHSDEQNAQSTAAAVCHAMGYAGVLSGSIETGVHASKRLNCPSPSTRIAACAVEDIVLQPGALYVRCDRQGDRGPRSELCMRSGQGGRSYNNLNCWTSERTGVQVPMHTRKPGAAHTLCGTAGINESRIEWYDGFQDDFFAYSTSRTADGRLHSAHLFKGALAGKDLLSPSELEVGERKVTLVTWKGAFTDLEGTFQRYMSSQAGFAWRLR
ncbi:hypothetical protein KFE25_009150 [Diacronema lutheri]|uniref:Uncharacterized protein n=1 Tax=Diacronema lutheri TaxID=2081491 RepID=A0A8J5XUB0_DIALT|nr:hypothetical protein KFE25_009150 [Diacronema lutheri]